MVNWRLDVPAFAVGLLLAVRATGAATGVLLETTSITLRDDVVAPINLAKRRLRFKASTKRATAANRVVPPAPGSADDPTTAGATLVVQGTAGTTDRVQIALPANRWRRLGTDAKPRGFVYRDPGVGAAATDSSPVPRLSTWLFGPSRAATACSARRPRRP